MRAIYFCENRSDWERVYCPAVKNGISEEFSIDEELYGKADLGKTDLSDVEILFSTWGIASLTEAEIKTYFPSLKGVFYAAGSEVCRMAEYMFEESKRFKKGETCFYEVALEMLNTMA